LAIECVNQAFLAPYWSARWVYRSFSHCFSVRLSSTVRRLIPRVSLVRHNLQQNPAHIAIKLDILLSVVLRILIVPRVY